MRAFLASNHTRTAVGWQADHRRHSLAGWPNLGESSADLYNLTTSCRFVRTGAITIVTVREALRGLGQSIW